MGPSIEALSPFAGAAAGKVSRIRVALAFAALALVALLALAHAPGAWAETCPNEALRQSESSNLNPNTGQPYDVGLSECRALEKVSPDYKQSSNVEPLSATPIAANGDAVSWGSAGNYEGEGAATGGYYVARRGSSAWSTANVVVPQRLISFLSLIRPNYSVDLSGNAWCSRTRDSYQLAQALASPMRCAVREQAGQWLASPLLLPFDGYFNGYFNGFPQLEGASAHLSHLVIGTAHLLPADTTTAGSLYELVDPTSDNPLLRLVNTDSAGTLIGPSTKPTLGGTTSNYQAVSADGGTIFFTTTPTGGVATVYARIGGERTAAVSNPSPAECTTCSPTAKAATYLGASEDGQRVFFSTEQQLLNADTDFTRDLYMYDLAASAGQHLVQVSGGGAGDLTPGAGAEVQGSVQVSQDGTHVYFIAKGVLTTIPNGLGQVASQGAFNVYVYERDAAFPAGRTRFVASVSSVESTQLIGALSSSQTTPDGRYLLFGTAVPLISSGSEADTDTATDVYRYDSVSGELVRVSVGEPSYPASGNGNTAGMNAIVNHAGSGGRIGIPALVAGQRGGNAALSDDGESIIFTTAEKLQGDDLNGGTSSSNCSDIGAIRVGCDVYLWHQCAVACAGGNRGAVSLISDSAPSNSLGVSVLTAGRMSASGKDVFFDTRQQLVPADRDGNIDMYDARVGGGFPYVPPPSPCVGSEGCHGSVPSPPPTASVGSADFNGPPNSVDPGKKKKAKKRAKATHGRHKHGKGAKRRKG